MSITYSDSPNRRAFRFARTQKEAGLEWFDWEDRIKPLRPLSHDLAIAAGLAVAAIGSAIFFL